MGIAKENNKQLEFAERKILLLQKKPYLSLYFQEFSEHKNPFTIQKANCGDPVLYYIDKTGNTRSLASRYNPGREAARLLPKNAPHWKKSDIVLVLGLANPLIFEYILPHLKEGQLCIAVDASLDLGRLVLQKWPNFWKFLERPGCHLFCGQEGRLFLERYLDGLSAESLSGVTEIRLRASETLHREFYIEVSKLLKATFKARMSDLMTRFRFEGLWLKNIICNTRHLSRKEAHQTSVPGPENLAFYQNALQEKPGLLVSAGPSLSFSLGLIRKLKKRAFVLACDTAARVLIEAGIFPHAVFTLDAQPHTLFHFLGLDFSKSILFSDIVVGPALFRHISPRGVIFSTTARFVESADGTRRLQATPGTQYAESIAGPIGFLQSGGSVATSAFDLLRFLGCNQIFLIGQDLAYTWRQIHSQGVHHYTKWQAEIHRQKTFENINESILQKRETFVTQGFYAYTSTSQQAKKAMPFAPLQKTLEETLNEKKSQRNNYKKGPIIGDYVLELYRYWLSDSSKNIKTPVWNLSLAGLAIEGTKKPSNLEAFVEALPEQEDLIGKLSQAPPLREHSLPETQRLSSSIQKTLRAADLLFAWEKLLADYPFLAALNRRVDVYIKRNQKRLSQERMEKLRKKRIYDALEKLRQGIERELGNKI